MYAFLLASLLATTPETTVSSEPASPHLLELSLKAGGHFPQLVSPLQTSFDGVLKVGYGFALDGQLQLFGELGYSQPQHTVSGSDPRLGSGGADYSSTVTVQDLSTTLGLTYFLTPTASHWLPYLGAGLSAHFLKDPVEGTSDSAFGLNSETSTHFGGVAFAGLGLRLGPGLLLGELRFGFTPISELVTGPSNAGALSVLLGYGLML